MSASQILREQDEEYEESLRQDVLREEEEMHQQKLKEQSIREANELDQAIKASLSEQTEVESETEKPLSPNALREVRIRYFEQKQNKGSNKNIKIKNAINNNLILKSKLRSGKT
jgi:hypothetical protein